MQNEGVEVSVSLSFPFPEHPFIFILVFVNVDITFLLEAFADRKALLKVPFIILPQHIREPPIACLASMPKFSPVNDPQIIAGADSVEMIVQERAFVDDFPHSVLVFLNAAFAVHLSVLPLPCITPESSFL